MTRQTSPEGPTLKATTLLAPICSFKAQVDEGCNVVFFMNDIFPWDFMFRAEEGFVV